MLKWKQTKTHSSSGYPARSDPSPSAAPGPFTTWGGFTWSTLFPHPCLSSTFSYISSFTPQSRLCSVAAFLSSCFPPYLASYSRLWSINLQFSTFPSDCSHPQGMRPSYFLKLNHIPLCGCGRSNCLHPLLEREECQCLEG